MNGKWNCLNWCLELVELGHFDLIRATIMETLCWKHRVDLTNKSLHKYPFTFIFTFAFYLTFLHISHISHVAHISHMCIVYGFTLISYRTPHNFVFFPLLPSTCLFLTYWNFGWIIFWMINCAIGNPLFIVLLISLGQFKFHSLLELYISLSFTFGIIYLVFTFWKYLVLEISGWGLGSPDF